MQLSKLKSFLESRGWRSGTSGKRYVEYLPPLSLSLPMGFMLEVPIQEEPGKGMELYFDGLLKTVKELYDSYKEEDFRVLLNTNSTIYCTRITDDDTKDGTIQLEKFGRVIDLQKKILKQAVIFLVTGQPIFGHADSESKYFLENSRSLPTARGSFITKIKLPEGAIDQKIETETVVDKVLGVLEFINKEVSKIDIEKIDSQFISQHQEYINIELLSSINNFFKSAQINNVEQSFYNNHIEKRISAENMVSKSGHVYRFIKKSRELVIQDTPIRFTGHIRRLNSRDPLHSDENQILIEVEGGFLVAATLNRDQYAIAIEAHRNMQLVFISGEARQSQNRYQITNVIEFGIAAN